MKRIAFYDAKPYDIKMFDEINRHFGFEIKYFENRLNLDTVVQTEGFDAVCVFVNDDVSEQVIQQLAANNIALVALRCAGYNNVNLDALYASKIHTVHVPAYSPYAVAEHAIALMMTLNRKTHKAYNRTRDNNFSINGFLGFDMHGKTAGIIGTGKIGKILAGILKGFGMRLLLSDKFPDEDFAASLDAEYVGLDDLYAASDVISLHCPLTAETVHLINKESIQKMKPGIMIINTGRGQLIDTKALISGLKKGLIGAAGLDVYEEESEYFFEDFSDSNIGDDVLARLLTFSNVLVTSHQAFFTREALQNIATTTLESMRQYRDGEELEREICYRCSSKPCRREKEGKCF